MQRDKIKMMTDTPLVFTLEDPRGKPMTSKYHDGTEYLYTVIHNGAGCLLYLPVDGSQALLRSGAKAGDEVELLKRQAGNRAIYTARVFSDAHLAVDQPPPAQTPRAIRMVAPLPPAPPPASRQQAVAYQQPAPYQAGAAALQPEVKTVHPLEETMQRCFTVGGRALWHAYVELTEQGIVYDKPTMEDLRAAGISLFIERTRK